jgi:hypothetical protein
MWQTENGRERLKDIQAEDLIIRCRFPLAIEV